MHRFLLAYITFMTCTSVVYLVLDITSTVESIFTNGHFGLFLPAGSRAICIAFASWGGHGFMLSNYAVLALTWLTRQVCRLVRLYGDLSGHRRACFIGLLVSFSLYLGRRSILCFWKHKFTSLLSVVGILMIIVSLTVQENDLAMAGYIPQLFSLCRIVEHHSTWERDLCDFDHCSPP